MGSGTTRRCARLGAHGWPLPAGPVRFPGQEALGQRQADDRLGVGDLAGGDEPADVGQGDALDRHVLLLFFGGLGAVAGREVEGEVDVGQLGGEPGGVPERGQLHQPARAAARSPPPAPGPWRRRGPRRGRRACRPGSRGAGRAAPGATGGRARPPARRGRPRPGTAATAPGCSTIQRTNRSPAGDSKIVLGRTSGTRPGRSPSNSTRR